MSMGVLITFSIVGLLIIFLSYLVKYKKQAHIISGYDEDCVTNKDGYCNWFGGVLKWPGIFSIITGCSLYWLPHYGEFIAAAFVLFTIIAVVIAIVGAKKYMK